MSNSSVGGRAALAGRKAAHRVLIDGFFLDRPYGFGRYLRELIEALDRHAPAIDFAVAVKPEAAELAAALAPRAEIAEGPNWNLLLWEQLALPGLSRKVGADLIHSPANTRPLFRFGARGVVTLHDLIFERQQMLDGSVSDIIYRLYSKLCLRVLAHSGDGIVSVSRTTADDLLAQHKRASSVIYNSASGFAGASRAALPRAVISCTRAARHPIETPTSSPERSSTADSPRKTSSCASSGSRAPSTLPAFACCRGYRMQSWPRSIETPSRSWP